MYVLGVGVAGGMVLRARSGGEVCGTFRNCPAMIAGMRAADEISADAEHLSRIPDFPQPAME